MKALGVIPARYDSKRFQGKALFKIKGKPLIEWVYLSCKKSRTLDKLIIATDDERIAEAARNFGAEVFMSKKRHRCGTERVAEAAADRKYPIVVNIQGDEMNISTKIIRRTIKKLESEPKSWAATAAFRISDFEQVKNPDLVKVIVDRSGNALYFSRSVIPYNADEEKRAREFYGHIGIYAFRNSYLQKFARLSQGPLEKAEKLEQLRILEHGGRIVISITGEQTISINRRTDLKWLNKNFDMAG